MIKASLAQAISAISMALVIGLGTVQASDDEAAVRAVAMNYLLGFYDEKPELLEAALSPELKKLGWGSRQEDGNRGGPHHMSKERALEIAASFGEYAKISENSHRKVVIFEVLDKVASVKVEAVWGIDYMHLAKNNGKWQIYNVIWQSWPDGKAVD